MPSVASQKSKHYEPMPLDRKPAAKAPQAYMKTAQPSSWKVGGKSVSPGWTSGGNMNCGGKRRPRRVGPA